MLLSLFPSFSFLVTQTRSDLPLRHLRLREGPVPFVVRLVESSPSRTFPGPHRLLHHTNSLSLFVPSRTTHPLSPWSARTLPDLDPGPSFYSVRFISYRLGLAQTEDLRPPTRSRTWSRRCPAHPRRTSLKDEVLTPPHPPPATTTLGLTTYFRVQKICDRSASFYFYLKRLTCP